MFKRWFSAAALIAVSACSALAADLPYKAVSPAGVQRVNWTGWFGGGSIGYAASDANSFLGSGGTQIDLSPSGFQVALQGGYDYQAPNSNLVFGFEVMLPLLQLDKNKNDPVLAGVTYGAKGQWAVLTTGKVGYAMGNWLPYVGAGVGFINVKGSFAFPGVTTVDDSRTHTGMLLMAGLRYMVNPNWWVGLQYMHGQYSSETYVTAPAFPTANRTIGFSTDAVVFQGSYRFTHY